MKIKRINYTNAHRELIRGIINFVFAAENILITQSVAAFLAAMMLLKDNLVSIDALYALKAKIITGFAKQKKDARAALAPTSFSIMSAVRAWAISQNNMTLANNMKVTLSQLMHMKYDDLMDKITSAIATVTPLVPQLTAYNITAETITDWQEQLDALVAAITGPQNAIKARKTLNGDIQKQLREAMDFLNNTCDDTASLFIESNPSFYSNWQNNRKLNITGIHHTRMDATVVSETGTPFLQAIVTVDAFTKNGKTYKAVSATTDENGYASVKEFEPGYRTITVSGGNGIITKTFGHYKFEHGKAIIDTLVCEQTFDIPAPQETPQNENA